MIQSPPCSLPRSATWPSWESLRFRASLLSRVSCRLRWAGSRSYHCSPSRTLTSTDRCGGVGHAHHALLPGLPEPSFYLVHAGTNGGGGVPPHVIVSFAPVRVGVVDVPDFIFTTLCAAEQLLGHLACFFALLTRPPSSVPSAAPPFLFYFN